MDYATYLAFLEHFGRNEETFQKILTNKELLKTLLNNFNNIEKRSLGLRYRFKEFYNKRGRSSGLRSAVSYNNLTG